MHWSEGYEDSTKDVAQERACSPRELTMAPMESEREQTRIHSDTASNGVPCPEGDKRRRDKAKKFVAEKGPATIVPSSLCRQVEFQSRQRPH
jgi:hypothetical protein